MLYSRSIECIILFILLPTALSFVKPLWFIFAIIWFFSAICFLLLKQNKEGRKVLCWKWGSITALELKRISLLFLLSTILLILYTAWFEQERLFSLVLSKPGLWIMVIILYPVLSVIPQEFLFRTFFFQRYHMLFKHDVTMILVSAILFGYAHIVFHNWLAPLLSIVGGILFGFTYAKTRSLALVSLEHTLYGYLIFTVGLGWYFYNGSVQ